jgi:hypothetical protein
MITTEFADNPLAADRGNQLSSFGLLYEIHTFPAPSSQTMSFNGKSIRNPESGEHWMCTNTRDGVSLFLLRFLTTSSYSLFTVSNDFIV